MLSRSPVREYTHVFQTRMMDRNQICPNSWASTVIDVLARLCKWQTLFSGRGGASKRIVNKSRKPAILQMNVKDFTVSKMSVFYHLAAQREALIILLQETHCTSAPTLVLPEYQLAWFFLSKKPGLATFVHERLKCPLVDQSPPISGLSGFASTLMDIDSQRLPTSTDSFGNIRSPNIPTSLSLCWRL